MIKVRYDDLLGTPYKYRAVFREDGCTDCVGIGVEIFTRAGWSSEHLPDREGLFAECVTMLADDPDAHPWQEVGDVVTDGRVTGRLEFGDMIACARGAVVHVSAVVDENRQIALSSAERHGAFACPTGRLTGVIAAYRLRKEYR